MSPLVESALKFINQKIDPYSGLSHPSDENAVKEMLFHLHIAGEILLAGDIESFATSTGWQAKDAEKLGSLAQQIGMGKNPRISGGPYWEVDIIESLKRKINE
jgi:hypothetical protein